MPEDQFDHHIAERPERLEDPEIIADPTKEKQKQCT